MVGIQAPRREVDMSQLYTSAMCDLHVLFFAAWLLPHLDITHRSHAFPAHVCKLRVKIPLGFQKHRLKSDHPIRKFLKGS